MAGDRHADSGLSICGPRSAVIVLVDTRKLHRTDLQRQKLRTHLQQNNLLLGHIIVSTIGLIHLFCSFRPTYMKYGYISSNRCCVLFVVYSYEECRSDIGRLENGSESCLLGDKHRWKSYLRLQRWQNNKRLCYFVNVYCFNKLHLKCRKLLSNGWTEAKHKAKHNFILW